MRIVSQNRNLSVDFSWCEIWMQYSVIYRRIGNDSKVIGQYVTEERAAEVFEDIHRAYNPVSIISENLNEAQISKFIGSENVMAKVVYMDVPDVGITTYDNYVYYMPKE